MWPSPPMQLLLFARKGAALRRALLAPRRTVSTGPAAEATLSCSASALNPQDSGMRTTLTNSVVEIVGVDDPKKLQAVIGLVFSAVGNVRAEANAREIELRGEAYARAYAKEMELRAAADAKEMKLRAEANAKEKELRAEANAKEKELRAEANAKEKELRADCKRVLKTIKMDANTTIYHVKNRLNARFIIEETTLQARESLRLFERENSRAWVAGIQPETIDLLSRSKVLDLFFTHTKAGIDMFDKFKSLNVDNPIAAVNSLYGLVMKSRDYPGLTSFEDGLVIDESVLDTEHVNVLRVLCDGLLLNCFSCDPRRSTELVSLWSPAYFF